MIKALLSTLFLSALSAFVPLTPIEPYLLVLATAGHQSALPLSLAAAAGQTAGKVLIFVATRATFRSARVRDWTGRIARRFERKAGKGRIIKTLDRPGLAIPIVLVSAVTGFPPLLAVSIHAARTRISAPVFALCCFAGRTVRFLVVMLVPGVL